MSVIIRLQCEPSWTDQGGGKRRGVNRVGLAVAARRLAKLIWIKRHPMSALGHKRTSRAVQLMSALPPKADIGGRIFDVRFVPEADATRFHIDVPESEHSALIESITF